MRKVFGEYSPNTCMRDSGKGTARTWERMHGHSPQNGHRRFGELNCGSLSLGSACQARETKIIGSGDVVDGRENRYRYQYRYLMVDRANSNFTADLEYSRRITRHVRLNCPTSNHIPAIPVQFSSVCWLLSRAVCLSISKALQSTYSVWNL